MPKFRAATISAPTQDACRVESIAAKQADALGGQGGEDGLVEQPVLLGDQQARKSLDVAVLGVNHAPQFTGRADSLFRSRHESLLHRCDQNVAADAFFPLPELQDG